MKPRMQKVGSVWFITTETADGYVSALYAFTEVGIGKLLRNFRRGQCAITAKGLARYSVSWRYVWECGTALEKGIVFGGTSEHYYIRRGRKRYRILWARALKRMGGYKP